MTEHQKYRELLTKLELSYLDLAEALDMKYDSVKNQLAPAKELPKWAKSMLLVDEKQKSQS